LQIIIFEGVVMKVQEGPCEMCGHYVAIRQKAHIVAEDLKMKPNLLLLCPSCHIILDTQLKPKLYKALYKAGSRDLPESWKKSIYEAAAEKSPRAKGKR